MSSLSDKRMGVLDGLIRAVCAFFLQILHLCIIIILQVKFVYFIAWEDRWINRVMDSREAEMKWMIKGKFN